jgi:hypothetical protein
MESLTSTSIHENESLSAELAVVVDFVKISGGMTGVFGIDKVVERIVDLTVVVVDVEIVSLTLVTFPTG